MTPRPRRALRALLAVAFALTGAGLLTASPASPASSASAAPDARLDLVLLLDGSGSIDDADWELQLQGYAAALRDRTNVPVDGSVAVSVIQWSYRAGRSQNTRLELPLTVLDSPATVDEVTAAVLAIEQMGDNTNPGDAVLSGAVELAERGRPGADGVLCMSTDGTRNGGLGLAGAVVTAQRGGVVDRYSVVAIEDGSFTEARAREAYGPHVFGGGQVTVARTTAEFTTMIAGCVADPVELVALEVTQGLQDLDNTVPVVSTRSTLVRAYLATVDSSLVRATARLHITRDGAPIPGSPFTPIAAPTTVPRSPAPTQVYVPGVIVDGDALGDRPALDRTLNFRIPAAQATGTWDLRLEYPGGLSCGDQAQNPTCAEQVTFAPGLDLDLTMVAIGYTENGVTHQPTLANLGEQTARVMSMLPISSLTDERRSLDIGEVAEDDVIGESNAALVATRLQDGVAEDTRWFGSIHATGGAGQALGYNASGKDALLTDKFDTGWGRSTAPHEIGHTLGLEHTVSSALHGRNLVGMKKGGCGELSHIDVPDYPHWAPITAGLRIGQQRPTLSPLEPARAQAWGTDLRFVGMQTPLDLMSPTQVRPLMSYCAAPAGTTSQGHWTSVPSWNDLLDGDTEPIGRWFLHRSDEPVGGTLHRAVTDADGQVRFLAGLPVDQGPTPDDPAGTHTAVVLDAAGGVLHAVRFTPLGAEPVTAGAPDAPEEPSAEHGWIAAVILPDSVPDAASLELRSGEQVLATMPVSANAPQVLVDVPTTGDQDRVTFTWEATDADGDVLTHAVRYSADDGASWTTVGMDLEGSSSSVPRWALAGSAAARVQVIASDGVNTAVTTSDAFAMPNLAPELAVTSPEDGAVVSGAQTIVLAGSAFDAEDGDLSAELVWTSDLDGRLGTGGTVTRRADELSEGVHVITATATDAAGVTSTSSVGLTVYRIAPDVPEPGPGDGPGVDPTPEPSQPPAPSDGASAPATGAPAAP